MEGVAKYVGFSSPAIMTTIVGSVSTTVPMIFAGLSSFSPDEFEARFLYEHNKMINATAKSNKIRARLPKRYGTGDFHSRTPEADEGMLAAFISLFPAFYTLLSFPPFRSDSLFLLFLVNCVGAK